MTVAQVAAVLGLIGTVAGGVYFAEDRYSSKPEVAQVGWRSLERDYENSLEQIHLEIKYLEEKPRRTPDETRRLNYLKERLKLLLEQLEKVKVK